VRDEVVNVTDDTERTSRYSDPLTERGGVVGRGAVLYDTRDPHAKPCCVRPDGRCLAHVRGVYEETTTGEVYYDVADGTWTTQEWIHSDDLLAIFEPAGWSVTGIKPTYLLTRGHGVEDHHDKMTDGGRCSVGADCIEGAAEGIIQQSMDLWNCIESAVHDTSHDLPANEGWLPAEVSVDITIQPCGPEADQSEGGDPQ
jgi:hypothetical protein